MGASELHNSSYRFMRTGKGNLKGKISNVQWAKEVGFNVIQRQKYTTYLMQETESRDRRTHDSRAKARGV